MRTVKCMVLALVAAAVIAPSAAAQVEVIDEAGGLGAHCSPSGCAIHLNGEWRLSGHVFGIESTITDCVGELDGVMSETGEASITSAHFENHPGSSACTQQPCYLPSWEIHLLETGPGQEVLRSELCWERIGGDNLRRCLLDLPITEGANHDYESVFQTADLEGTNHVNAPNCEFRGEFHLEGTDLEIVH